MESVKSQYNTSRLLVFWFYRFPYKCVAIQKGIMLGTDEKTTNSGKHCQKALRLKR